MSIPLRHQSPFIEKAKRNILDGLDHIHNNINMEDVYWPVVKDRNDYLSAHQEFERATKALANLTDTRFNSDVGINIDDTLKDAISKIYDAYKGFRDNFNHKPKLVLDLAANVAALVRISKGGLRNYPSREAQNVYTTFNQFINDTAVNVDGTRPFVDNEAAVLKVKNTYAKASNIDTTSSVPSETSTPSEKNADPKPAPKVTIVPIPREQTVFFQIARNRVSAPNGLLDQIYNDVHRQDNPHPTIKTVEEFDTALSNLRTKYRALLTTMEKGVDEDGTIHYGQGTKINDAVSELNTEYLSFKENYNHDPEMILELAVNIFATARMAYGKLEKFPTPAQQDPETTYEWFLNRTACTTSKRSFIEDEAKDLGVINTRAESEKARISQKLENRSDKGEVDIPVENLVFVKLSRNYVTGPDGLLSKIYNNVHRDEDPHPVKSASSIQEFDSAINNFSLAFSVLTNYIEKQISENGSIEFGQGTEIAQHISTLNKCYADLKQAYTADPKDVLELATAMFATARIAYGKLKNFPTTAEQDPEITYQWLLNRTAFTKDNRTFIGDEAKEFGIANERGEQEKERIAQLNEPSASGAVPEVNTASSSDYDKVEDIIHDMMTGFSRLANTAYDDMGISTERQEACSVLTNFINEIRKTVKEKGTEALRLTGDEGNSTNLGLLYYGNKSIGTKGVKALVRDTIVYSNDQDVTQAQKMQADIILYSLKLIADGDFAPELNQFDPVKLKYMTADDHVQASLKYAASAFCDSVIRKTARDQGSDDTGTSAAQRAYFRRHAFDQLHTNVIDLFAEREEELESSTAEPENLYTEIESETITSIERLHTLGRSIILYKGGVQNPQAYEYLCLPAVSEDNIGKLHDTEGNIIPPEEGTIRYDFIELYKEVAQKISGMENKELMQELNFSLDAMRILVCDRSIEEKVAVQMPEVGVEGSERYINGLVNASIAQSLENADHASVPGGGDTPPGTGTGGNTPIDDLVAAGPGKRPDESGWTRGRSGSDKAPPIPENGDKTGT